jgi:GAF domain-containing protein
MGNLRKLLFSVGYPYDNPIDRQRAVGLLVLNWIVFLAALGATAVLFANNFASANDPFGLASALITLITPLGCILTHRWLQQGRLNAASWLFVVIQTLVIGVVIAAGYYGGSALLLAIPLAAAASFLGRRGLILIALLQLMFTMVGAVIQSRLPVDTTIFPAQRWQADFFLITLSLVLAAFFLYTFNGLALRLAREAQRELSVMRQIVKFASSPNIKDEESVYTEALRFVRTQLGYPFAQIFYIGSDGKLSRRLRVSLGVRTATEQPTDTTLSESSAISQAAASRNPVVVSLDDAALRWSHFLPSTTYGIALPIINQDTLLGVLDVQSEDPDPFTASQINALRTLVENVGSVATHFRLIQALRENVRQQEEVTATLRGRLQELRQGMTSQVGGASWEAYLQHRGEEVFGFDLEGKGSDSQRLFTPASDLPDTLRAVLETGALQVTTQGDIKIVNVPINLRGEVLGAMSFTLPKERVLTERQIETAQIVANRLALALENKRLFEQTQAQALRERRANEATNLLISATNVEAVMNVAASSFNEALGAISTRIHLQPSVISEPGRKEVAVNE